MDLAGIVRASPSTADADAADGDDIDLDATADVLARLVRHGDGQLDDGFTHPEAIAAFVARSVVSRFDQVLA